MIMSSTMTEHSQVIEINTGSSDIQAVTFTANGEHLVSCHNREIQVWRLGVQDYKQMATIVAERVQCLAVSKNGRWIAAGTFWGLVLVWDAQTYRKVFHHKESDAINGVDFSPDSTRLLVASANATATVWDVASGQRSTGPLHHESLVTAAKYSPQGDRLATATRESVRVWDNDGRLLVDTPVTVSPWYNTGLLWSNNHLFVLSDNKINEIEASTGSAVAEWPVPDSDWKPCILLPQHGEFAAYSTNRTVTFWDTSTHTQLGLIQHPQLIRSIALSPDDQFLAIGADGGKIILKSLSHVAQPDIRIDDAALYRWKRDQLVDAEELLTAAIPTSQKTSHHVLASRALVRARRLQWDAAIIDAEKSIRIQPSVGGYIAKSVALVGKGEHHKGFRACDIAFEHFHTTHVRFLLLIKAIIVFMAGEHDDAISRVDDLISMVTFNSMCYAVQAYMYLLLGNSCMKSSDYPGAIRSFQRARAKMPYYAGNPLSVISLIFGWNFDSLGIIIRQSLCEALYAAGRAKAVGESLLEMVHTVDGGIYMSSPIAKWVSKFTQLCLSEPSKKDFQHNKTRTPHATFNLITATPLLREWAKVITLDGSWKDALDAALDFVVPKLTIYQAVCEHLETVDRVTEATECFQHMMSKLAGKTVTHDEQVKWVVEFKQRCAGKLACSGDAAVDARQYDDAITQYSAALSLDPAAPQDILIKRIKIYVGKGLWEDALDDASQVVMLDPSSSWGYERVLMEWAKVKLTSGSWKNAMTTARGFKIPRIAVYRALYERLEVVDCITDATECFREMEGELAQEARGDQVEWFLDFKSRCRGKLEVIGDTAMSAQQYDEAISKYSAALSLDPATPQVLFAKRSTARAAKCLWKDALNDADQVIKFDPSSPWGYERKWVALSGAGHHKDTLATFETMLLKMSQSPDPVIRVRRGQYAKTRETIRRAIQHAIRESPRVLINTTSGRLCNKSEQAAAFESLPVFTELIQSMTAHIDHARIEQAATEYYRYATFSHKWDDNEPLFEKVLHILVYDLDESPTHDKLQMFCKIVRDAGFQWAWSDTCCINKADHFVLQEALVAMFKWYEGSALTIVYLRGVRSPSRRGDLVKSIWNTRAWTFQEYHASKVVRFYTEDWKPYLNLDIPNHKESPEILSEMEAAAGVSARALMALRPGSDSIREKLCLASRRETTLIEDAAYSLLGIFSITLPVVYGEGDKALGRLLAQLLTNSGDASILAWTGNSGSFNSCLPANIVVFNKLPRTHIPAIEGAEMDMLTARLQALSPNMTLMMKLYDQLNGLPVPFLTGRRMKLPCLTFKLGPVSASRSKSGHVFRAQTAALGIVEIRTTEDLSKLDTLYLVHPWIDFLLDRQPVGNEMETVSEASADTNDRFSLVRDLPLSLVPSNFASVTKQSRASQLAARLRLGGRPSATPREAVSLQPPSSVSQADKQMQALQVLVRLRQPFGALLFTPDLGGVAAFRRVAAESLITVQVEEITPTILNKLNESIRVLDVL